MKRAMFGLLLVLAMVATACTSDSGGDSGASTGGSSGGVTNITLWQGFGAKDVDNNGVPNYEAQSIRQLIDEFNSSHPAIHVDDVFAGSNDKVLQKLTVALQGGEAPDISYQYGSSLPQLAQAPGVIDLTDVVQESAWNWDDFIEGARTAATFDGRVLGVPALIDNLAIIYNKDLFDAAGVDYPTADWTWDDFRTAAKALTDPAKKQFGFAFPASADEDTVWHYDAMLWEAGGDILTPDNSAAAFNSPAGLQALTTLRDLSVTDGSVYNDLQNAKIDDLFNSGNIGMVISGPWALPGYPDINYGTEIMPSYDGSNHQTIAGPDMWIAFDNGAERKAATLEFLQWFTAQEQVLKDSMLTGHLPTRTSVLSDPGFADFGTKFPGVDVFAQNLQNVLKARPVLATYPQISEAMGEMVVAVMLGDKEPQQALDDAEQTVNDALALPA
jgi:multiple sugar transport system substrate-binding protein